MQSASTPQHINKRKQYLFLLVIGLGLTLLFGAWWFNPEHIPHNFRGIFHAIDIVLFLILTYIVWHEIIMEIFAWYVAGYIKKPEPFIPPAKNLRVAYLTAFVPGAEPYDLLEKTLKAMVEVDYPHDTWLLDEGNDPTAQEICKKYGVFHYSRKNKRKFNTSKGKFARKTKGGNYNSWLHHHDTKYDIVAQHDVDFVPRKDFLTRTLGYFKDPRVAFVGTPQLYGNIYQSWIARGAAEQTFGFYGPMQKGLHGHDMTLLIGANHIMRVEAYKDIGGYTAHITEDLLTGMKLYTKKWKSVYVAEPLLVGEGPTTWQSYFGQQMRWAYGCMDIAFRHSHSLLPKMKFRHLFNYFILLQFYFSGVAQVAGIALLSLYFMFGINSANMAFLPILTLYLPLIIYQVVFQSWLQQFNIAPHFEKGLLLRGKLLSLAAWPIYFLAFIGAVRGKKLTYVVTPKGDSEEASPFPSMFTIHFTLGSITFVGMIFGYFTNHTSPIILFWALLNTIFMYYFFFAESVPTIRSYMRSCLNMIKNIVYLVSGRQGSQEGTSFGFGEKLPE